MSSIFKNWQILKLPSFRWFAINCIFSTISNGLMYISMTWELLNTEQSSLGAVAFLMICFWAPTVIMGPYCGVITDRYSRKLLLIISCGARAALLLVIAGFIPHLSPEVIYTTAILLSVFGNLYGPAAFTFIREIVSTPKLVHANAVTSMAYEFGNVAGMGSAGFIIALHSTRLTVALCGLLLLFSTLCLFRMQTVTDTNNTPEKKHSHFFRDFKEGLQYLWEHGQLRVLYTVQLLLMVNLLTAPILLAPFAKTILHASAAQFGLLEACLSIGVILGGLLSPWLIEIWSVEVVVLIQTSMISLVFLIFSFISHLLTANILYFLVGVNLGVWALITSRAQVLTDINYQGRVQSMFNSLTAIIILVVYLLLNLASEYVPLRSLYHLEVVISGLAVYLLWRHRAIFHSENNHSVMK